jgi:UDP-N-acetylglucosamine--N-acetylmuramyl-(pentapeptide) pyrophosphoryl-undecaprenol N-acetylglucosamine transferase
VTVNVLIAAGGTGGHVYPALAISEAALDLAPDAALSFVGSVGGMERTLVDESGLTFTHYDEVRAGPLHGVGLLKALGSLLQIALGTVQAFGLVRRYKPNALLMTGGWVNLPVALAAWALRVPSLIYLPDIEPGLAIKMLRGLATRVATTTEDSFVYFRTGQAAATGYPLRKDVLAARRDAATAHFKLDPARKTLLVFGGSRGARTINNAVLDILPELLASGLQVVHVTGTLDWPTVEAKRTALGNPADYHAFPYLHEDMGLAMAAADLAVCRSGASTLGELPYFGLPAILVPYPYAWRYQKVNAEYLVSRGAGVLMEDAAMPRDLLPTIRALVDEPGRLAQMREHARRLARPDGAVNAARELLRLAGHNA